jgi:uncharacterized protein (DUF433 family)
MSKDINRENAKENVGSGWDSLIDEVYDRLPINAQVTTVKEKMGSLRIYVKNADELFYDYLQDIQHRSATMCEICGEPGTLRDRSRRITFCHVHNQNETRMIVSTADTCGGSPRIAGTRLTCEDVVMGLCKEFIVRNYLKIYSCLREEDILNCLQYCSTQQCVHNSVHRFCQGCTLSKNTVEDEVMEDIWRRAHALIEKHFLIVAT